ncbi:hypothetical protein CE195_03045 [Sodalis-like symbiont of Philaenus spumarius]|nr:hypothetical protein CE195_03045 [Sodalis-like symbiont of Philaenus spumarius]
MYGASGYNLTLRTRIKRLARKTICFSRSVEIHEKVIGALPVTTGAAMQERCRSRNI